MTQTSLLGNVQRLIEITELWELKKETQYIKNITNIFDIFEQTKTQNFVKIYSTLQLRENTTLNFSKYHSLKPVFFNTLSNLNLKLYLLFC